MRATWTFAVTLGLALTADVAAEDGPPPLEMKAPSVETAGKKCGWKAADGLQYEHYVPKTYDPRRGANLIIILHGTGMDRRWGMANQIPGEFRPDDVLVSPDGTSKTGETVNFLNDAKDCRRVHALQDEIKKALKIRATYLYGHSNGAFFAYLYAGAYPDDVQGVVAQAGNIWNGTSATPKNHKQAIAVMHGTQDPVVSYFLAPGVLAFYREAKYPMAHCRSLEGWNHWPNQWQTANEIAWCEGMTTDDPERAAAAFDALDKSPEESGFDRDHAAVYLVAKRVAAMANAPDDLRARATKTADAVEALAKKHADAVLASLGKDKGDRVADAAWVGHLPTFLRDFDGVPSCDALAKVWNDRVAKQRQAAGKSLDEYWRTKQKDPAKAFAAGTEVVRDGFLWCRANDAEFLKQLADWRADAAKLKLSAAALKAYDEVVPPFVSGRKKGVDEYAALNKAP